MIGFSSIGRVLHGSCRIIGRHAHAVAVAVVLWSVPPAQAADASTNATAAIVVAIGITKTADLDFGSIVPSGSADTVAVSAADARTCGGELTCDGGVAASAFEVTGGSGLAYAVTLPADNAVSLTGAGADMDLTGFVVSNGGTGTLTGGTDSFTVGAVLNVGAAQAVGNYNATYNTTVNYQ